MKRRIVCILLCAAMLVALCALPGCAAKREDSNAGAAPETPAADKTPSAEAPADETPAVEAPDGSAQAAEFALALLRGCYDGGNTLVSPLSLLCALAMTANGAAGETRAQMEALLGLSVPELNAWLHSYVSSLPEGEAYKLRLANGVWLREGDGFEADELFLRTNADYYGASIYEAPFDDGTLEQINDWVCEQTDGMVEDILSDIDPDAVMLLVNALSFDARWQNVYREDELAAGTFTTADGAEREVVRMTSNESLYLSDDGAVGFLKPYADGKYVFVALLPDEGVSLEDYAASLTGERLLELLRNAESADVRAELPKFESEYSAELSAVLSALGMTDAFDPAAADLSGVGSYEGQNLSVSRVLHKTYVAVDEAGTRAGAAAAVEVEATSLMPDGEAERHSVVLDRPFLYLIVDGESMLPVFVGAMTDPAAG